MFGDTGGPHTPSIAGTVVRGRAHRETHDESSGVLHRARRVPPSNEGGVANMAILPW